MAKSNHPSRRRNTNLKAAKNKNGAMIEITQDSFEGIMPHPDILNEYKAIHPDLPERLLAMAEKEGDHRRLCDRKLIRNAFWTDLLNNLFALLSVGVVVFLCYLLIKNDNAEEAASVAKVVIVSLASVFVFSRIITKPKEKS